MRERGIETRCGASGAWVWMIMHLSCKEDFRGSNPCAGLPERPAAKGLRCWHPLVMGEEGLMTDYEWPDEWPAMSQEERQRFLHAHRQRLYAFWKAEAEYQSRREERVNSFRVDDELQ